MLGFSVFLNSSEDPYPYIKQMKEIGFQGVFTSIHIPEEDSSLYLARLTNLGKICQNLALDLSVDISGNALEKIGLSFDQIDQVKALGVTCIRPDYGIDLQTIANLSHEIDVALNASTLTTADISKLKEFKADFSRMEAWHNYYPRPETGLSEDYFRLKNHFLRVHGLKLMAFVAGDDQKRGPLFEGLPTLETHRKQRPFVAYLDLFNLYHVDKVYLGDPGISGNSLQEFSNYLHNQQIKVRARRLSIQPKAMRLVHTNRQDSGAYAIRSQESRLDFKGSVIEAENTIQRSMGTICLDNYLYQRYQGELQIILKELPADPKVNVIGQVIEEDMDLLPYIGPGCKFQIEWMGGGRD